MSAVTQRRLRSVEPELAVLTRLTTVALGGAGARSALAERVGAVLLQGDPVAAAAELARGTVA